MPTPTSANWYGHGSLTVRLDGQPIRDVAADFRTVRPVVLVGEGLGGVWVLAAAALDSRPAAVVCVSRCFGQQMAVFPGWGAPSWLSALKPFWMSPRAGG